jgi:hypothetical protein
MASIVSIEPKDSTALSPGSKILIKAKLSYRLVSNQDGEICIVVQDQTRRQLLKQPPNKCVRLTRGSGIVNFEEEVEIPSHGVTEMDVFFPLLVGHADMTKIGDYKRYTIR